MIMMDATTVKIFCLAAILLLAAVSTQQIEANRSEHEHEPLLTTSDHLHHHHHHGHEECDHEHHQHGPGKGELYTHDEHHQQEHEPTDKELHDHSHLHSRSHHLHEHYDSEEHHDHHNHHPHAHHGKHFHEEDEEELEKHSDEIGFEGHHDHDQDHPVHHHDHDHHDHHPHPVHTRSNVSSGVWLKAVGCSLLVSLASLICLLLLPFIAMRGRPSKTWVDALAGFGAGSMLGDALLHQLPHAFGGGHSHSHSHSHHGGESHNQHAHDHESGGGGHAHSLEDLSVGLAALGGILLFFVVEKIVRRSEELASRGRGGKSFGHHHHHHHLPGKMDESKDERHATDEAEKDVDSKGDLRKRTSTLVKGSETVPSIEKESGQLQSSKDRKEETLDDEQQKDSSSSSLVLGYLNLVSDGVHNFTDGMALGSAFLLRGTVGGWSRTLFLLTHELPQEVGDYGILLSSGFGVVEALAFNFLSALMAVAGTALALLIGGGDSAQSKMIEGFTAGGFIYVSIGAVMPGMHSQGNSFNTSASQVAALCLGMSVALAISLAE